MITTPVNPHLQPEARRLLSYLAAIEGKAILTGQHTLTRGQEELAVILRETGKLPAICGFELLAYSPNIHLKGASEACVTEVMNNRDTLDLAMDWGKRGGILTFTWHWFSPLGGADKSFYTKNTRFDPAHAHSAFKERYNELKTITAADKGMVIAETGVIPDAEALMAENVPWLWYMTWSGGFVLTEKQNSFDALRRLYHHPYAVTLDKLQAEWLAASERLG